MNNINQFEEDLEYIANQLSEILNIFNETVISNNQLVMLYGNDEFVSLKITFREDEPNVAQLRMRTRDMASTWDNVSVGFSKTSQGCSLLTEIKQAAHISLKRNSIWYIDQQIKNVVGDRVLFTELTTNKGYLYKITFTNGYDVCLSIVKDDAEYNKSHDQAKLYMITTMDKTPLSEPITADECILLLVNMAMQEDKRVAEFIKLTEQYGGKSSITYSYRTEEESFDEVKALFENGYALKLKIVNSVIELDVYGKYQDSMHSLEHKTFENIKDVYDALKKMSNLPKYEPYNK